MKHSHRDLRKQKASRQKCECGAIARGFRFGFVRSWAERTGGASAVEFALVLPFLAAMFFAIIKFGIVFSNYIQLMNGVENGAREASAERSVSTPLTTTIAAVKAGAPNLTSSSISVSMLVNGTKCSTDVACQTALIANAEATVQATYPCNLNLPVITFSSCTLSSSASEIVQ